MINCSKHGSACLRNFRNTFQLSFSSLFSIPTPVRISGFANSHASRDRASCNSEPSAPFLSSRKNSSSLLRTFVGISVGSLAVLGDGGGSWSRLRRE